MNAIVKIVKKDPMLFAAVTAALASILITPPTLAMFTEGDWWQTLAALFMLLTVLDGFKSENLFLPVIRLTDRIRSSTGLSFFLVYGVFATSMFVTNDVSLIIFVPLTIMLFRKRGQEHLLLPILAMENIAAVRGSLLTPFGSPQNLFLFTNSGISVQGFLWMMLPLCAGSFALIAIFILWIHRKDRGSSEAAAGSNASEQWKPERRLQRILYLLLFILVVSCIVSRTQYWPYITVLVAVVLLVFDRKVFRRVDYALLATFLCFFIFSHSISGNARIADYLNHAVSGNEYLWSIGISQIISNVPASIVLWPFTTNLKALLYGLDSAGLVTVIGSLASVINLRLYIQAYPGKAMDFMAAFEKYSLAFFLPVFFLQMLLI